MVAPDDIEVTGDDETRSVGLDGYQIGWLHRNHDFSWRFESTDDVMDAVGRHHADLAEFNGAITTAANNGAGELLGNVTTPQQAGDHIGVSEDGAIRFGWSQDAVMECAVVVCVDDALASQREPRSDAVVFFVDSHGNKPFQFGEHRADWDGLRSVGDGITPPVSQGDLCILHTGDAGRAGIALGLVTAARNNGTRQ